MTTFGPAERAALLALADDEHLMGQRHTEWIGVAPFLEEDLAFASIGQDELGHAATLYELLADDGDADALAFGRDAADYRSCALAEAACRDWSDALVRHFLYDELEHLRWEALSRSSVAELRGAAERALAEEQYHRRHAQALLDAIWVDAGARERVEDAAGRLMAIAHTMFDDPADAAGADAAVVGPPLSTHRAAWQRVVDDRFGRTSGASPRTSTRMERSADFAEVYARMREVISLDPTAHW